MAEKFVLDMIAQAGAKDSLIYLQAAIRRREEILDGGEVICREYSKEDVIKRDRCYKRIQAMYEAGYEGDYEELSIEEYPECRIL